MSDKENATFKEHQPEIDLLISEIELLMKEFFLRDTKKLFLQPIVIFETFSEILRRNTYGMSDETFGYQNQYIRERC